MTECRERLPPGTNQDSFLAQLLELRGEAIGKVFKGHISLPKYSDGEKHEDVEDEKFLASCLADTFAREYIRLLALAKSNTF
jgi:hypothetical protein